MKTLNFFFLWALTLGVVSCIEAGSNEGSTFKEVEQIARSPGDPVSFALLKATILEPKCLRCHAWAADETRVDRQIVAGDPERSLLFQVVEDGSMPSEGPALTLSELDIVRQYIIDKGQTPNTGGGDDDNGNDTGVEPLPVRVTFEFLNQRIIAPKCLRCHDEMETEEGLAEYVIPGRSTSSLLYEVLEDGSMPRRSAPLTEDELLLVRRYIDAL